jgi:4-hydroxybenzoate polyprenyltransferase
MSEETIARSSTQAALVEPSIRNGIHDLIAICRPQQWVKNIFVLAPILFTGTLFVTGELASLVIATACFCLFSSCVYIVNDLIDSPRDRLHPRKCSRPIASGQLSIASAIGLLSVVLTAAIAVATLYLPRGFLLVAYLYLLNSIVYCLWFKHRVILDVIVISTGFVLRLLAGCAAIRVTPSPWLVVCGFFLALVLGFGKRRIEVGTLANGGLHRTVLFRYNSANCDTLLAISTTACLVAYIAYTLSSRTIAFHRTANLFYTTPLVAYGLLRYVRITQGGTQSDGPAEILISDWSFPAIGLLWVGAVLLVLAFR